MKSKANKTLALMEVKKVTLRKNKTNLTQVATFMMKMLLNP